MDGSEPPSESDPYLWLTDPDSETYLRMLRIRIRSTAKFPSHTYLFLIALVLGQVGSVLVLRDPAVLVTLKMEYVNITLNNILSIYR